MPSVRERSQKEGGIGEANVSCRDATALCFLCAIGSSDDQILRRGA